MTTGKRETAEDTAESQVGEGSTKKQKVDDANVTGDEEKKVEGKAALDAEQLGSKFASLKDCLADTKTPILALYFASSWCPDCQESTPFVTKVTSSQEPGDDKLFDLIYVSSDKTSEDMAGVVVEGWGSIPFDKEEERSNLKRHFGACAAKEMEELGMTKEERKSGIPTLILIEKVSGKVLTTDAVSDLVGDKKVEDPLATWKGLLASWRWCRR